MPLNEKPMSRRPFHRQGGVAPAGLDLLRVAIVLVAVDAIAALLLVEAYLPQRRREAFAAAPAQLSLLARDRQNALTGWVRERLADVELTASLLAGTGADRTAELLDDFVRAYGYESAFLIDQSGTVLLRRGAGRTDDASAVRFALETMKTSGAQIDFVRIGTIPRVFAAVPFPRPRGAGVAAVLFVSDPYEYVYPLFSTGVVASKTGETNLIGLHDGWGLALNPYRSGSPPPMTVRRPIPRDYAARVLTAGEHSVRYNDRNGKPVIAVAKVIPRTPWLVVAKIDEQEVLAGAEAETWRLAQLLGVVSLILAMTAFVILRSRRVHELRAAQEQLARLFEHSTTGIIIYRVIFDPAGKPADHQVVDMNPAAEELLGVTAAGETGKRSEDAAYLQWPDADRASNYEVARGGPSIRYEGFNPLLGRWFEIRCFSPRYGQFAHLFTDITERRKTEEAIRKLSARLLRVQDETRRRLARELHDTVGQNLAGVRMNLGVMKRASPAGGTAEVVEESIAATDEAISQVRTLSFLLHPPMIDQAGLLTALRWYIDGFERRSGISTTLEVPDDLGALSRDVETTVVRVVQESLTNIQRHAGSATANVSLRRRDDWLSIAIADHGRGLPATVRDDRDALLASGVGIAGMNERVRELGGELTIRSTDDGTAVLVTLPAAASH